MSRPATLGAILFMVAAMACLSTQDALAKLLMASLAPVLIIWTRYAVQFALAAGGALRRHEARVWRTQRPGLQALRAALVIGGSIFGYAALARMPVAEFTAIYCLVPTLVALVARYAMGEPMRALAWVCIAGGLAGCLLIVRPGGQVDAWGAALSLAGVACYTGFQTLTGVLARHDSPQTIHLYTSALGAAVFSPLVPWLWPAAIAPTELALLLTVALAGTYGQYFMVIAFSRAPVSAVSPYLYSAIAFSVLLGWALFGQVPDALSLAGMALIAGFGVLAVWSRARAVE
ncbi:MAG: DMT family transporter [Burkholderiaceae bacterium]